MFSQLRIEGSLGKNVDDAGGLHAGRHPRGQGFPRLFATAPQGKLQHTEKCGKQMGYNTPCIAIPLPQGGWGEALPNAPCLFQCLWLG